MKTIDIVFDGPPSHESGRFVEVERDGKSISIGEWQERKDGDWVLRIPDPEQLSAELQEIRTLAAACFIPSWRDLIPARLEALLFTADGLRDVSDKGAV